MERPLANSENINRDNLSSNKYGRLQSKWHHRLTSGSGIVDLTNATSIQLVYIGLPLSRPLSGQPMHLLCTSIEPLILILMPYYYSDIVSTIIDKSETTRDTKNTDSWAFPFCSELEEKS